MPVDRCSLVAVVVAAVASPVDFAFDDPFFLNGFEIKKNHQFARR